MIPSDSLLSLPSRESHQKAPPQYVHHQGVDIVVL